MLFDFNLYSSLLLPAFVQGTLFSLLLLWRGLRQNHLSDKLLAMLLALYTLYISNWMLGFGGWYDEHDWHTTFMFYVPFNHWLAVGPLLYFYFQSLTNRDFRFAKKHAWHFLPWALWILRSLYFFVGDVVVAHWWRGEPFPFFEGTHGQLFENGFPLFDGAWFFAEFVSVFVYLVLTLRLFKKYRQYLLENFSETEKINFTWLRNLLVAMMLGHAIWIGFDIVDYLADSPLSYIEDWYSFFFIGVLIYYLSIEGYLSGTGEQLRNALHFDPAETAPQPPPAEAAPNDPELDCWKPALLDHMTTAQPYLDPELTLNQLANQLKLPAPTLSRVINSALGQNFNDFVNAYRVQAVQARLLDPANAHLSLLAVALDCGFNSKATFNRAFRKHVGMSPSEFVKNAIGSR